MTLDKFHYEIIPSLNKEDSGASFSARNVWNDSGILIEYKLGREADIYLDPHKELYSSFNEELQEYVDEYKYVAYPVRVEYPITLEKVINQVEKDYYNLFSDSDYNNWTKELLKKQTINPDSPEIKDYNELINWVTNKYYDNRGLTLEQARERVLQKISDYDTSDRVNGFYINNELVWADKATRVGLMNSVKIEKDAGKLMSTLWFNDRPLTVSCELALSFLSQVELYAVECYNKTAEHRSMIKSFNSIKDILDYDYTSGYPERLSILI